MKPINDDHKIPLLKLDLGCKFTATCSAYIQYTICIRINGEKEEPITFRSTEEFEVHITGDKSLFEPLPVELPDALKNINGNNANRGCRVVRGVGTSFFPVKQEKFLPSYIQDAQNFSVVKALNSGEAVASPVPPPLHI